MVFALDHVDLFHTKSLTQSGEQRVSNVVKFGRTMHMRLLIFGFGFTGAALAARLLLKGWAVSGTSRQPERRARLCAMGVEAIDPDDSAALRVAANTADAVLIAAPPSEDGCPGWAALPTADLRRARPWIGYLSTTGVYGDRGGRWAFETSPVAPRSPEASRRVAAETAWMSLGDACPVSIFRLPGIYGPGRSALDRVRAGEARSVIKPGHVFSRIHVDDIAAGLEASITRPDRAGVYNLCDDEPAAPADVNAYAADLLGLPAPPKAPFEAQALSPMARRFWAESKRVSNAKAKAALRWRPLYPTYREGLRAVLGAGG
jgi:nucleoside-diphosphate-sugar epimerase